MKNTNVELKQVLEIWNQLLSSRPAELDFAQFGYSLTNASNFTQLFTSWSESIDAANLKTKPITANDEQVCDAVLTRLLRDLKNSALSPAISNGFGWLLQSSPFFQLISEINNYLVITVERRVQVRKEIIKLVESKTNQKVLNIEAAGPIADRLISENQEITRCLEDLKKTKDTSDDDAKSIKSYLESTLEDKLRIESQLIQFKNIKGEAEELILVLNSKIDSAKVNLDDASVTLPRITDLLTQAHAACFNCDASHSFSNFIGLVKPSVECNRLAL